MLHPILFALALTATSTTTHRDALARCSERTTVLEQHEERGIAFGICAGVGSLLETGALTCASASEDARVGCLIAGAGVGLVAIGCVVYDILDRPR